MKRTPVIVVAGQVLTEETCDVLSREVGTIVVKHRYDGQVVVRSLCIRRDNEPHLTEWPMELSNCCVNCTVRDDLLILLRRLHRRDDVRRIVLHLDAWAEPEPVCWAINNLDVHVDTGYNAGPASLDVRIAAVISTVAVPHWLTDALSADEIEDDRTVAQVVVGQAEFADILVMSALDPKTQAVLRRLAPQAAILVGTGVVARAVKGVEPDRRRDHDPHATLLTGEPPLAADGDVQLVEFQANRPFHPERLHRAIDNLLDGVVRIKGRAWLASQPDTVMWIESAGGGLRVGHAGTWLAASTPEELRDAAPERTALAGLRWDEDFGDRHISMTALVCGANPGEITRVLSDALLTDEELAQPSSWAHYDDPFSEWHEDPCEDLDKVDNFGSHEPTEDGDPTGS